MVNESEEMLSAFAQMYFYKELVQDRLRFSEAGSTEKELADLLLNLGDIVLAIQLKAREEADKTDDQEKEIKWLNHKCKNAKKQVKDSIRYIRTGSLPDFENGRNQQVSVDSEADIIPLIIFMNNNIGNNYEHILRRHSKDGMDINCLSYKDFETVCKILITPIEIADYLKWRLDFYQEYGNPNFFFFDEEAVLHRFLDERYGIIDAKEMEAYVVPFQWMLHQLPERVVVESAGNSSYPLILFFSHFDRKEIKVFVERIEKAKTRTQNGECEIIGSLRSGLRKYVIFFVSSFDGRRWPMTDLEKMAKNVVYDKLLQVVVWWENDVDYRIDYVFQDTSKQYLK